jgi:hypothetical protein
MSDTALKPLFTWRSAIASKHGPKSPTTRHVLLTLGLHMNERGGSCFPSVDTLVGETGLTKRSVCTHLEIAERDGWIRRGLHGFNGRGWKRYEYQPVIPPHARQGVEGDSPPGTTHGRGERHSPPPSDRERGEAGSPRNAVKKIHHQEKAVNAVHQGRESGSPPPTTHERGEADSQRNAVNEIRHQGKVVNLMHEGGERGSPEVFKRGSKNTNIPPYKSPHRSNGAPDGKYPAAFERLWAIYPNRAGSDPKKRAFAAWQARLQEGADPQSILDGARAYARFCSVTGKLNTEYVQQAATFLGEDRHFEQPWSLPSEPVKRRSAPNLQSVIEEQANGHHGAGPGGQVRGKAAPGNGRARDKYSHLVEG